MKYYIHFLFFLFIGLTSHAQYAPEDFTGRWICDYRTKSDGSVIIEPPLQDFIYRSIEFIQGNQIKFQNNEIFKLESNKYKYVVNGDTLVINGINHKIDYFKNDSLIIKELHTPNEHLISQPFKYYFIWEPIKLKTDLKQNLDSIVAPIYLEPFITINLAKLIIPKLQKDKNLHNQEYELNINTINKTINLNLKNGKNNKTLVAINNAIEQMYSEVDIKLIKNIENITIPLTFYESSTYAEGKIYSIFKLEYSKENLKKNSTLPYLPDYVNELKYKNFGIDTYQKGKRKRALEYFIRAHNYNIYNVETMMNIAAIYFELGEKEKACEWWDKLKKLGQVEGAKRYDYYCK